MDSGHRSVGRGHPWLFMLALGTMAAALWEGDLVVAVLAFAAVVWTVMR